VRIKAIYIMIIVMLASVAGKAQMGMFSPMASSAGGYTTTASPFIVDGKGKCLVAGSGLTALRVATHSKGSFGAGCVETPPVATPTEFSVSLGLYPNPTRGMTTIKAVGGQFDPSLSCQIRIMSVDGKIMLNKMVPMSEMKTGFVFDASAFAVGTYVAIIEFMNQRFPVKFIRA
jgi:hypothetical protein